MRAKARASRFRLLLALLLVLLGTTAVPGTTHGYTERHPAVGAPVPTVPSTNDDGHDPLRVSATTSQSVTVLLPGKWSAAIPHASHDREQRSRLLVGEVRDTRTRAAALVRQPSRAPPSAV